MSLTQCKRRLDQGIRENASQHAASLAAWISLRNLRPYNYSPCSSKLPRKPLASMARLRCLLLEHELAFIDLLRSSASDAEQLMVDVLSQLSDYRRMSSQAQLTSFSLILDPYQSMGLLVAVAQLIPAGRIDEAESILLRQLEACPNPALKSRLLANLALVYEIREDGKQARRYASEALNCDRISPLAMANYDLYCVRGLAG